ncbi:hypothetical protein J4226_06085 [Candidatus Pacearchaeota archaeon]|nr:hypothetical protein [Candidatus Pacearchaeota archaeon]
MEFDDCRNILYWTRPIGKVVEAVVTNNRGFDREMGMRIFPEGDERNLRMALRELDVDGFMYSNWGREYGHPGFDRMSVYVLGVVAR